MTTTKSKPALAYDDLEARIALHQQVQNTPDVTLNVNQAALFLGSHPKKLARWRLEKRPPFPVDMNSDSRSGVEIRYRVGTLIDFVRQSRTPSPSPASAGYKSECYVNGKRIDSKSMSWFDGSTVEADEIEEPFFMDSNGLVLAHGWEDSVASIAERLLSPACRIDYMSWDNALACVWQDEALRLSWLGHSDNVAPGLRAAVEAKRYAKLAKI